MRRTLKRVLFVVLGLFLAFVALIGVEVVLVLRRDFLPTKPALRIGGTFGDAGAPRLTFAVLGDSTAAGVGAESAGRAYATLLAQRVARDGYRVRLVAVGISGARVADVVEQQLPRVLDAAPDVVVVAIGANDVTHATRLGAVEDGMRSIVDRLTESGAAVVVAGPPDMRSPVFHEPLRSIVGWRGRAVEDVIEDVAREAGVPVVPLADETRDFFAEDPDRYYSDDDFHPSAAGYALWADAIFPHVEKVLPNQ